MRSGSKARISGLMLLLRMCFKSNFTRSHYCLAVRDLGSRLNIELIRYQMFTFDIPTSENSHTELGLITSGGNRA